MQKIVFLFFAFLLSPLCAAHWGPPSNWEPIICPGNANIALYPTPSGISLVIEKTELESLKLPMPLLRGARFSKDCATVYLEWLVPLPFLDQWQPLSTAAMAA